MARGGSRADSEFTKADRGPDKAYNPGNFRRTVEANAADEAVRAASLEDFKSSPAFDTGMRELLRRGLLATPGPEISKVVRNIVGADTNQGAGTKFFNAQRAYDYMTQDAKEGKQVSLTAMAEAGNLMRQYRDEALAAPPAKDVVVTPNNLSLGSGGPDTYISGYDKSDSSGQSYDQRVVADKGKKKELAMEAVKILGSAPEAFAEMKVADVEKFVNTYVKANLTGATQKNFTGIKWTMYPFPS